MGVIVFHRKKILGIFLILISVILTSTYTYLIFYTSETTLLIVLKLTVYVMVLLISCLILTLGYILLRTPKVERLRLKSSEK